MPPSTGPQCRTRPPNRSINRGDREDTTTFMSDHEGEFLVAAYLGFSTTGDLRQVILSHHFLDYLRLYDEGHVDGVRRKAVLNTIRDRYLDPSPREILDVDQIEKYRPEQQSDGVAKPDKSRYTEYLARIVIYMVQDGKGKSDRAQIDHEERQMAVDRLSATRPRCRWAAISGIYDMAEVRLPVFRPQIADETDLEPINRALVLLRAGMYMSAPAIVETRFMKVGWKIGESAEDFVPLWMKAAEDRNGAASEESSSSRSPASKPSLKPQERAPQALRTSRPPQTEWTTSADEDDEEPLPAKVEVEEPRNPQSQSAEDEPNAMVLAINNENFVVVKKENTAHETIDLVTDDKDAPIAQAHRPGAQKRKQPSNPETAEDDAEEEEDLRLELARIETLQKLRQLQKNRRKAA